MDAIAATSAGGVPQSRIHRILADLESPLAALHEQGLVHGALTPATIGLDVHGKAHLMPLPAAAADGLAAQGEEPEEPRSGYAAFEQYADDALLPRGPWTDVYGLSAVACQLITGAPPPDAEARRDHDDYVPLAQRMPAGYDAAFLAAIDAGLAMAAARRPNSIPAYLASFGGMEPAPAMPALAEPEVVMVQEEYDDEEDPLDTLSRRRRRLPFWGLFLALLVAVLALPTWLWMSSGKDSAGNRLSAPGGGSSVSSSLGSPSFVPLTQRDGRQGATSRLGGDDGSAMPASGGAPAATNSANTDAADSQGRPAGAAPTESGATGERMAERAGERTASAAEKSGPDGGAGEPTSLAQAGGSSAPGAGAPSAQAEGHDAGGAPQPYRSTVTLGGGSSPATADAASAAAAGQAAAPRPAKPATGTPVPVRIDVRPWGQIVIDGVVRGVSPPLKELRLPPGTYAVTIRNTGLPSHRMTLEVKPGTPAVISHVFN
ncbi:hypothetical protein C7R54_17210 [Achromobacter aloeverae]|uniref:Protein kinase domain-containing protein n=1 Tax=Achromobacter aloeverae TaxID=1750518 RepID=A0A4Q1HGZ6_9BURK|nr:hypothetical protein C7R54_17210 [Achromobacter aloeverae]